MRAKGFTVVEVLIVISCIAVVAAISYPIIASAKRSANKTHCISNLKQIGVAVNLYREQYDGAPVGTPSQMGLPPILGMALSKPGQYLCRGNNPDGNGYYQTYPDDSISVSAHETWSKYTVKVGNEVVTYFDPNHQQAYPLSYWWENWFAIGVKLDGSVFTRRSLGFPTSLRWWHK